MSKISKYNLQDLEVNQEIEAGDNRNRIAAACSTYGKKHGKKFSTRILEGKILVKRLS